MASALGLLLFAMSAANAFEYYSSRPELNRRAIAGIWKLTPVVAREYPMKEFTTYPKKKKQQTTTASELPELLLMLKEDGSFQQYLDELNDETDLSDSWKKFQKKREQFSNIAKGTWEYLDGILLLAADRLDATSYHAKADGYEPPKEAASISGDTLLQGRVVAQYNEQLQDNPVLQKSTNTTGAVDAHLSVPKGTINIGKFFYPKHHPSFFEQPMFRPVKTGTFALRQVLGSLKLQKAEPEIIERYQRKDFHNKTFLLTSHPMPRREPKQRWSIRQNKFVSDKVPKEQPDAPVNIRVMEVAFHANNTFSSVAGLGESAILRGKFDVIGSEKDQIWFQVVRFGFGRSVSGSVYSEGRMLSHEDAKAYWGTIHRMDENDPSSRLEVRGSVMLGWGLEPLPVARFIMRETDGKSELTMLDDEEEDNEVAEEDRQIEAIEKMAQQDDVGNEDWVDPESSFQ